MHTALRLCMGLLTLSFGLLAAGLGFLSKSRYAKDREPKILQRLLLQCGGIIFALGGVFELFIAP